ncbi:MAG TPA: GNAT family N-acetyltransferase [Flavihumibacter sp.]|nr:GNAT family N-acetyltransferase [Flavihumibacter sp.]
MRPNTQPTLENDWLILYPLQPADFDDLFAVAADPAIWAQHPNKDRWKKEVFTVFFEGAMASGGAFRIVEKASGQTIGSTRFYDYAEADNSILIGYTFYATRCWGRGINPAVKKLMLDYIFQWVDRVIFHVGADNLRSQIAITRVGAQKIGVQNLAYHGEQPRYNFVYEITRRNWLLNESENK